MSIATVTSLWEQLLAEYISIGRARDASESPDAINAWTRAQHADYFVNILRHQHLLVLDPLTPEKDWHLVWGQQMVPNGANTH